MKTLYESLLDIDNIETDTNVIKYISPDEFQKLYKEELNSIDIDKDEPICITKEFIAMLALCNGFNAKYINVNGIYPKSKIEIMDGFASKCEKLISFVGPDSHENYINIKTLSCFFYSDTKLKTFDLNGIAKSARNIKHIDAMFKLCSSIKDIDLSYFDLTNLVSMNDTFSNCTSLRQINLGDSKAIVNVNNMCQWDTDLIEFNAPNMILIGSGIFSGCKSLKNINVRYIDVSNEYYNIFDECSKLMDVNIYGLNKKTKHEHNNYIDLSWAVSLSDKSWDFLFKNLGNGDETILKLPDIPKRRKLIKKYESGVRKHNFQLI